MSNSHFDVIIIGAGLSGISAGYHLRKNCPDKSYTILEGRSNIGGTWDLFKYPGIRSDSDMHTLGFSFRPWKEAKAIADGPAILKYMRETADQLGIQKKIQFGKQVTTISWQTDRSQWTVHTKSKQENHDETTLMTCNFLFVCTGYYKYSEGYTPNFDGMAEFKGQIMHPQKWDVDYDYNSKKVIVIGSGATAVTLIPEMAKKADTVTMLQRSPTYMIARPSEDSLANILSKCLPDRLTYKIIRWKNILIGLLFFQAAQKFPEKIKQYLMRLLRDEIGPHINVDIHFKPNYNPWDQRLCLVPNGDLFESVKKNETSIITEEIDQFTPEGIKLKSGKELKADLIVTATGINLEFLGGIEVYTDEKKIAPGELIYYKGMMYSDIPNLATSMGYTNASWTLKCDLICHYVCRLLNHMKKHNKTRCTPRIQDTNMKTKPYMELKSGYVLRSAAHLPKQGYKRPWCINQNYLIDLLHMKYNQLEDGAIEFT